MLEVEDLRSQAVAAARARLSEIERNKARYDSDLEVFAADCLTIRPKVGGDTLLRFNDVQRRVDEELGRQRHQTGKVRMVIVKARQPGVSTYICARYYHRVSRNRGLRAFIFTHEQPATDNVFEMVERMHQNNPHAPHAGAASAKELFFDELDSGFEVGTAGSKGAGRSYTIQLLHWSEVAYSPNAEDHAAGLLQAIPGAPGTEVILESTANGIGGLFYNTAMAADRGEGDYRLIFIPWFEHGEYATRSPNNWEAPQELAEYGELHKLTKSQIYWMYAKNADLATKEGLPIDKLCWKFRQEYPGTLQEAFRASREGAYIGGDLVLKARKFKAGNQDHAPLLFGCDFATGGGTEGGDNNVFIDRQGRAAGRKLYERFVDKNAVSVASKLGAEIDRLNPAAVFMDVGGGGAQVHDILMARGYGSKTELILVDFGSSPRDGRKYANKRAEMHGDMRDWFMDPGGAEIPDDDILDGELTATNPKPNFHGKEMLEKKEKTRERLGFSPDGSDALATTFAEPVHKKKKIGARRGPRGGHGETGWMGN